MLCFVGLVFRGMRVGVGVGYGLSLAFLGDSCKPDSSAYLEPNSQSLQKTIGEVGARTYLEPIRNSMQKPIGGRSKIPKRGMSVLAFSAAINRRIRLL